MFSKLTAVLATAVATVSAKTHHTIPQFVPCDVNLSCNKVLSQA